MLVMRRGGVVKLFGGVGGFGDESEEKSVRGGGVFLCLNRDVGE